MEGVPFFFTPVAAQVAGIEILVIRTVEFELLFRARRDEIFLAFAVEADEIGAARGAACPERREIP